MSNTLTNLIPDAYVALDVVSQELRGFIPAVARDPQADRVAVGQTLRSPVSPVNTTGADITAAMSDPTSADQTIGNVPITIKKSRYWKFSWSGTEQRAVNAGPGFLTLQQDQIAQAVRAALNEIETDLGAAFALGSSRAYGTAGTTPFATAADLSDIAQLGKILDDNGAPKSDRHIVMGTIASANLRGKHSELFRVNESGNSDMLRMGTLGNIMNFGLGETAYVGNATAGTGASYVLDGAQAVGATSLLLKTGSGTILAGDIITIGSFKYVVATALTSSTVVIAAPGLRAAAADAATVTVNATSVRNVGFTRNSMLLNTRLPDLPEEGDKATARETIVMPGYNIAFELAIYPGFRMNTYFIGCAWGANPLKAEHSALLLG